MLSGQTWPLQEARKGLDDVEKGDLWYHRPYGARSHSSIGIRDRGSATRLGATVLYPVRVRRCCRPQMDHSGVQTPAPSRNFKLTHYPMMACVVLRLQ